MTTAVAPAPKPGAPQGNGLGPVTDYRNYAAWEKVVAPNGQIYYRVPGTGYLYDPFLSATKGRPVLFTDPSGKYADAQKAKAQQDKLVKQQEFNQSPSGQLVPVVAGTGGAIAATQIPKFLGEAPHAVGVTNQGVLMSDGTFKGATSAIPKAPVPTATTPAQAAAQAGAAPTGIPGSNVADYQNLPNASAPGIPGSNVADYQNLPNAPGAPAADASASAGADATAADGSGTLGLQGGYISNGLSAIAAAKGAYDSINGFQQGGTGLRGGLTELGAGIGGFGGPIGSVIGAGMGNLAGYGLKGDGPLNHLALMANPLTWPLEAARLLGFNLLHKTTKQIQAEHTGDLLKSVGDDKAAQDQVNSFRTQYNAGGPPDPTKPYDGKYATWDEYQKAGLQANDLTGSYGNLNTYGPDYLKYTPDQQLAITQKNIDDGLYASKSGEAVITDEEKAKKNRDDILAGSPSTLPSQPKPVTNPKPGPAAANTPAPTNGTQPGNQQAPQDRLTPKAGIDVYGGLQKIAGTNTPIIPSTHPIAITQGPPTMTPQQAAALAATQQQPRWIIRNGRIVKVA